jgi:membrane-bound lytic murein transglycosylase B
MLRANDRQEQSMQNVRVYIFMAAMSVMALPSLAAVDVSPRPMARPDTVKAPAPEPIQVAATQNPARFNGWLRAFEKRARAQGISQATLNRAFARVQYRPDVIQKDRKQSEFTKQIWEYLDTAVSDTRIQNGKAALRRQSQRLARIERTYKVEAEVVTAIWGLESAYGTFSGDIPVMDALATLAFDGRRAKFFEAQLIAALKILQAGDTTPTRMKGSWAGAMGHTQFMPTSFLDLAVDFTGDGRRDIWGEDPSDALASTAAYLKRFGWTYGQPWGMEITLPRGFNYNLAGERIKKSPAEWNRLGVRLARGGEIPNHGRASILLPAGARGVAFVIFNNFHVIERYNKADAYVIAVGHLSDRIQGKPDFKSGWPRGDRALSFTEKKEMQRHLRRLGLYRDDIDGVIGPNTIQAIREFQARIGDVPDGYVSLRVLQRLR